MAMTDALIGIVVSSITLAAAAEISNISLTTVFSQYSGVNNRIKAFKLINYFTEDVKAAADAQVSDDGRELVLTDGEGLLIAAYRFRENIIYISQGDKAEPAPFMATLKAEDAVFSNENGIVGMSVKPDSRSEISYETKVKTGCVYVGGVIGD